MFEDDDLLLFSCPQCRQPIKEEIATLKTKRGFTCPRCTHHFHFAVQTLTDYIDNAKRNLKTFTQGIMPGKGP